MDKNRRCIGKWGLKLILSIVATVWIFSNKFPEESVDLIYVDPLLFSNRNYEVIWGDGYELGAFEDGWKRGIENYIL